MIKLLTPLLLLLLFASCGERKNHDGSAKNYSPISYNSECNVLATGGAVLFDTLKFKSIGDVVEKKLVAVLGDNAFTKEDAVIMRKLLYYKMFTLDEFILKKELILLEKDNTSEQENHTSKNAPITHIRKIQAGKLLHPTDLIFDQKLSNAHIHVKITSCSSNFEENPDTIKWEKRGDFISGKSQSIITRLDTMIMQHGRFFLSVYLSIDDKSGLINEKRQYYKILIPYTGSYIQVS
jgi:hypothetical protein